MEYANSLIKGFLFFVGAILAAAFMNAVLHMRLCG